MFGDADRVPLEKIQTRRGDDVLAELNVEKIDLLKVDVEGAEMHVLRGLDRYFSEGRISTMMLEINAPHLRSAGATPPELLEFVHSKGFSVADIRNPKQPLSALPNDNCVVNVCCRRLS